MADRRTAGVLHAHAAHEDPVHPHVRHLAVGARQREEEGRGHAAHTAATLWCSAAVGCLAGVGMFVLAAFGTAGVVGVNLLLRPLGRRMDREPGRTAGSGCAERTAGGDRRRPRPSPPRYLRVAEVRPAWIWRWKDR
ncbi:MgtC/SapB family protein [Streptomyces sp. NPDC057686]|uniref:MgtC/SapB family protein n=1 Tax=Streptomyces sp. NPDC057686 TaxID=3346212 RepID=UPI00367AC625